MRHEFKFCLLLNLEVNVCDRRPYHSDEIFGQDFKICQHTILKYPVATST